MTKSKEQIFDDAMTALLTAAAAGNMVMYKSYNGVLEWLEAQPNQRAAKERIGGLISLGSNSGGSGPLAVHRALTLALLLVMATRYAASSKEISARRTAASTFRTPQDSNSVMRDLIDRSTRIVDSHAGILIQPQVYEHAHRLGTTNIGQLLRSGRDTAKKLVGDAYTYAVRISPRFRDKYEYWFGTAPPDTVRENLKCMYDALRTKSVNFSAESLGASGGLQSGWGDATPQSYAMFMKQKYVNINLRDHIFDAARTGTHSSEIVADSEIVDEVVGRHMELTKAKEELSSAFFADVKSGADIDARTAQYDRESASVKQGIETNAARFPSRAADKISVGGVVVHETSHNVVKTDDVKVNGVTMYGPNLCGWLARTHPDKAVDNADSYRLFCEEFMA